jgi:hypothetical protein
LIFYLIGLGLFNALFGPCTTPAEREDRRQFRIMCLWIVFLICGLPWICLCLLLDYVLGRGPFATH